MKKFTEKQIHELCIKILEAQGNYTDDYEINKIKSVARAFLSQYRIPEKEL